jgi:hypothetical protein
MSEMFVMRRADGELFTEEIDGKWIVPLWSSDHALARYKERNPELLTFLPARLTRSLLNKIRSGLAGAGTTGFFLLGDDDPDADLDDGKPISLEGITLETELPPQPAQVQL